MTRLGGFTVPADHPCLPGHFPGRPIVPGVLLLDHLIAAAAAAWQCDVTGLAGVKFLRPVLPNQPAEILCAAPVAGRCAFAVQVAGQDALRGSLLLAEAGEA